MSAVVEHPQRERALVERLLAELGVGEQIASVTRAVEVDCRAQDRRRVGQQAGGVGIARIRAGSPSPR